MQQKRWWTAFVLGLFLIVPVSGQAQDKKTYTLAVVPQARSVEVIEKWTPFARKLSQEVGINIDITPYNSVSQFEADLHKGVPDLVYMNPYEAVTLKTYIPLIRDRSPLIGILVARKGGPFTSVKDVNGKEIAFPAPNAFAASLYMRALLIEREKIKFTPQYVKTHSNVYRTVAYDKAAAGGGVKTTLAKEPEEIMNHLTVIYETPPTPSHPLSAHPRVPETVRNKIVTAVLGFGSNPANKDMLTNIQIPEPVEANYQRDYSSLKNLKLEKYIGKDE